MRFLGLPDAELRVLTDCVDHAVHLGGDLWQGGESLAQLHHTGVFYPTPTAHRAHVPVQLLPEHDMASLQKLVTIGGSVNMMGLYAILLRSSRVENSMGVIRLTFPCSSRHRLRILLTSAAVTARSALVCSWLHWFW